MQIFKRKDKFFSPFKRCAIFPKLAKMWTIFPVREAPIPRPKKWCDSPVRYLVVLVRRDDPCMKQVPVEKHLEKPIVLNFDPMK